MELRKQSDGWLELTETVPNEGTYVLHPIQVDTMFGKIHVKDGETITEVDLMILNLDSGDEVISTHTDMDEEAIVRAHLNQPELPSSRPDISRIVVDKAIVPGDVGVKRYTFNKVSKQFTAV